MFEAFPLAANLIIFAAMSGLVWVAGTHLSWLVDEIAEQTKIARAFLGLILLATATGLPEMVTSLTAASAGSGVLALNNMFGGIPMQVAVLAVADIAVSRRTLTSYPRKPTVILVGLFLIIFLSLFLVVSITGDIALGAQVGATSTFVAGLYVLAMYFLRRFQGRESWSPVDLPDEKAASGAERLNRYEDISVKSLTGLTALAGLVILIAGVVVVQIAEVLAVQTGLGSSFIGVSLLAITTSLPELSTSIAAVRIGAYTMAMSNVFGSNLIMAFLVFPTDLFFRSGPILNVMDDSAAFALLAGIILTAAYSIGLLMRPRKKLLGMGMDSLLVLVLYAASLVVLYHLR